MWTLIAIADEVRVVAHLLTVMEFGYLYFDDRNLQRRRQWLWMALILERLVVLILLAVDLRVLTGSWLANRWLLTPATIVMAVTCGWYVWQRWELKRRVSQHGAGGDSLGAAAGGAGAGD